MLRSGSLLLVFAFGVLTETVDSLYMYVDVVSEVSDLCDTPHARLETLANWHHDHRVMITQINKRSERPTTHNHKPRTCDL